LKARPRKKTRAIVFDLDGTLVDSLPLVLRAFAHALEPFGPRPTMELFARLGGPPARIFSGLVHDQKHVPAAMKRLHEFNREHHHLIRPFDGVGVVLEQLRTRGAALAVWTGRDRASTDWLLQTHGLDGFFSTVLCGDDLPSHKPDPAGLQDILRQLAVKPAEALLVGDADVDVLGGAACNVDTLLIGHAREVEKTIRAKAWRTVVSPFEAYELALSCVA
jgi:pyrophosphatase PpaX